MRRLELSLEESTQRELRMRSWLSNLKNFDKVLSTFSLLNIS